MRYADVGLEVFILTVVQLLLLHLCLVQNSHKVVSVSVIHS